MSELLLVAVVAVGMVLFRMWERMGRLEQRLSELEYQPSYLVPLDRPMPEAQH